MSPFYMQERRDIHTGYAARTSGREESAADQEKRNEVRKANTEIAAMIFNILFSPPDFELKTLGLQVKVGKKLYPVTDMRFHEDRDEVRVTFSKNGLEKEGNFLMPGILVTSEIAAVDKSTGLLELTERGRNLIRELEV